MTRRGAFDAATCLAELESSLPRALGQIDRDPDSPTYGSCDRGYWMYRLHDFESGVLRQASLSLAALAELGVGDGFDDLSRDHLRSVARAINTRNAEAMQVHGWLDEYFPGEQSYPGTVFAAYATLRSAQMLAQPEIVEHVGLRRCAERLAERRPTAAANQDVAAAAFLALYAEATGWRRAPIRAKVDELLDGGDGRGRFLEYGGGDLGYATVSLHFLACMSRDQSHDVDARMVELARFVADHVSHGGRLGGEYASRSTTYWLPFGLVVAGLQAPELARRFAALDLREIWHKLDDRYLMHYCLPSLALAARELAGPAPAAWPDATPPASGWSFTDQRARGLWVARGPSADLFVGANKGGTFVAELGERRIIDCGYRVTRDGDTFATCVLDPTSEWTVERRERAIEIDLSAPFRRFRSLTASPVKTVALRALQPLGAQLNAYFRRRLVSEPVTLPGPRLHRRIQLRCEDGDLVVEDRVVGLESSDRLAVSPPVSMRLVPSARVWQAGESEASERALACAPLRRRRWRLADGRELEP